MLSFNKIVNKLCKKRGKLFFKDDIFEFIDPERRASHHTRLNKVVYSLKSQDILLSIKAGVYVIPTDEDLCLNKIDLLEKYYLALLKKIITKTVGSHYFIGGVKSLEFHMKNYEVPEKIYIINRSVNKKVMVGSREIIFKTIMGKINNGTIKK